MARIIRIRDRETGEILFDQEKIPELIIELKEKIKLIEEKLSKLRI